MDIFDLVREYMGRQFEMDPDSIKDETTFEELGADSLDIIDMISLIENELDAELDDEVIKSIKSVSDIVRIFEETM